MNHRWLFLRALPMRTQTFFYLKFREDSHSTIKLRIVDTREHEQENMIKERRLEQVLFTESWSFLVCFVSKMMAGQSIPLRILTFYPELETRWKTTPQQIYRTVRKKAGKQILKLFLSEHSNLFLSIWVYLNYLLIFHSMWSSTLILLRSIFTLFSSCIKLSEFLLYR